MSKKALWIGLAVSACGLALVSRAQADDTSRRSDDSPRAAANSGARQAPAPAAQLLTTPSASPLIALLGSGLVAVAIAWAAIRKYVASLSA